MMMSFLLVIALCLTPIFEADTLDSKVHDLMDRLNCTAYRLDDAHPKLKLRDPDAVWLLMNLGPAELAVWTSDDPGFQFVLKPDKRGKARVFVGDTRYAYTLGHVGGGASATIIVCVASGQEVGLNLTPSATSA